MDLIEVGPNTKPPVCKILDYGKLKYEEKKKQQLSKKKQHVIKVKEIRLRPRIDDHDLMTKLNHGRKFLQDGAKLKVTLMFRGREMEHIDLGMNLVKQAIKDLAGVGKPDDTPKLNGRFIIVSMSPLPKHLRVLKFNSLEEIDSVDEDEEEEDFEEDSSADTEKAAS